jgi:DNA-binding PadR family transcriptional regulator
MSAHETRMLILGAVALFEPVNGYQIRRELLSWQVDRWAKTNPGSIYHGLTSLTNLGHLVRHDLVDGGREVAVYELTPAGREELRRLMIESLETVDAFQRTAFHVAFSMLPLLDRAQVQRSLTARRVALEATVKELADHQPGVAPPHATRSMLLWLDIAVAELAWLRETIEEVRSGALAFEMGEEWGWTPPPEDPGWQMNAEREKYRALLGR